MNNEELKDLLIGDLNQPNKIAKPKIQNFRFITLSLFIILFLTLLLGVREDLSGILTEVSFYIEFIILISLVYILSLTTLELSTPGINVVGKAGLIFVILALWPMYLSLLDEKPQILVSGEEPICSMMVLISSIIFSIVLFSMITRNYPTKPKTTVFIAFLTCSALGGFLLHLICPGSSFDHVFFWHYLPIVGVPIVFSFLYLMFKAKLPKLNIGC